LGRGLERATPPTSPAPAVSPTLAPALAPTPLLAPTSALADGVVRMVAGGELGSPLSSSPAHADLAVATLLSSVEPAVEALDVMVLSRPVVSELWPEEAAARSALFGADSKSIDPVWDL